MRQSLDKYYYSTEALVPNQNFGGVFDDTRSDEPKPPRLTKTECFITFEASQLVRAGDSYGDMSFGDPIDYFQEAKFIMAGKELRVAFDLDNRKYLPEMQRIKNSV